jgi:hypothetical protein
MLHDDRGRMREWSTLSRRHELNTVGLLREARDKRGLRYAEPFD